MSYWPFWLGAASLASVALGYLATMRRPMGVSSALASSLDPEEFQARHAPQPASDLELAQALEAATRRAFAAPQTSPAIHVHTELPVESGRPPIAKPRLGPALDWNENVLFLAGIMLGAALSALLVGLTPSFDVGATYRAVIGSGPIAWSVLFLGGIFVGFGTRLAAGCTSGHGLVGCGSLRPGSIVSTACFFGTAIVVSLALAWVAG